MGKKCLGDVGDRAQSLLVAPEFDLLLRCPEVIARHPCLADDLNFDAFRLLLAYPVFGLLLITKGHLSDGLAVWMSSERVAGS